MKLLKNKEFWINTILISLGFVVLEVMALIKYIFG